jgi:hypothetical protein
MQRSVSVDATTPLPVGELAGAAWRSLGASVRPLWPVLIAWSLFAGANAYLERLITAPAGKEALLVATALLTSVPSGVATRAILGSKKPWWVLDRGLVAYVVLETLGSVLIQVPFSAQQILSLVGLRPTAGVEGALGLAQLVAALLMAWTVFRLTLWPIGKVMDDRSMTLQVAWRRMRGAMWSYIGASFVAGVLPMATFLLLALLLQE